MANSQVQEFLNCVATDEVLQKELAGAMNAEDDREAVTNLAQSKGYEFTAEELWQEIQHQQQQAPKKEESDELNDEELEAVAGGEVMTAAVVGGSIAAAAGVGAGFASHAKW